jgi:[protein-PII] uridylyltransferase
MRLEPEKILARAREELDEAAGRDQLLVNLRKFLKLEAERLRIRHRFGLGGCEIARGRSYVVDAAVSRACRVAASECEPDECAVVAIGGYGRGELAPCSDVDLLFLRAGRPSKDAKQFVERALHMLWDAGLAVGHSFRSIRECVAMAQNDLHSRNALTEARFIWGSHALFRRLLSELEERVMKSRRETEVFLDAMRFELEARYNKFGRAVCLQEPNVKESAGGLRDLHAVLWFGRARFGSSSLEELRDRGYISSAEYISARRAYDFLLRVRNEAHFSTGRKTDLLTLDLQPILASNLGYEPKKGLQASELFMRDYYCRAQELNRFLWGFLARAMGPPRRCFGPTSKRAGSGFQIRRGRLELDAGARGFKDPLQIFEAFRTSQARNVPLGDQLRLAMADSLRLVNRSFRSHLEAGRAFIELFRQRGRVAHSLRQMHETGFLSKFLPEFARITNLIQHDFYHRYTVDEHTLRAIEVLDGVARGQSVRFQNVFAEIRDAAPLYLGLLLHDIGKSRGSGHVRRGVALAQRIVKRLGLQEQMARDVVFLVENHLLMSHLAERRDLSEEALIREFASMVGTLERLNMLLLLTYADTSAVGPGIWNDWKEALLWELYTKARSHLGGHSISSVDRASALRRKTVAELSSEFSPSEVERHLAMLPERYLRASEPGRVAEHLRTIRRLEGQTAIVSWQAHKHCTELTIYARDQVGLFARMAGTLTCCGANILSADLYTREDGIVIDTIKMCEVGSHRPIRAELKPKIEERLMAAIEGRYDVAAAVEKWLSCRPRRPKRLVRAKPSIKLDSKSSATSTIIEVKAEDEPGLAYKIASAISALGLNITLAKISTEKSLAFDVFYVTDSMGRKLDPTEAPNFEAALEEALAGGQIREAVWA